MIYVLFFMLLVGVIAIVTNKLNTKTPCDHNWVEQGTKVNCCKCGKKIPNFAPSYNESFNEAYSEAA